MPRRSSGGKSASRSARRTSNPPASVHPNPAPAPVRAGSAGSLVGSIVDGFFWSSGNAIGHRVIDAIWGPRTIRTETVATEVTTAPALAANATSHSDACGTQAKAFQDCLNSYGDDISKCQFYMDVLSQCRSTSGSEISA
ncbi:OLC1v1002755C1 [Oldenlandia corymbosa var. corymbosa]|uniref:OLC1v1002755C1 n=1 Tax=Oldenlandia corymbosa var. corymbosa TaxID=529605 RepID=A0AAV1D8F0_OLDCO|nr:OLC1v1002755C1 [Oldenlandia corymbosa var. corymbosa]